MGMGTRHVSRSRGPVSDCSVPDPIFHRGVKRFLMPYFSARLCRRSSRQPGLKMDLCIHDVRAYLDFTRQRASQREVRRGSAVALGWCKAELIGVEQKAALMSTYGKRLSAWAAG